MRSSRATGCLLFLSLLTVAGLAGWGESSASSATAVGDWFRHQFDFGIGPAAEGYVAVDHRTEYTPERGYGWTVPPQFVRDRGGPDDLLRDFVYSRSPAVFRVDAPPGVYRVTLVAGDMVHGDHVARIDIPGLTEAPVGISAGPSEFVTASVAGELGLGGLEFRFGSPVNNWILNALTTEPSSNPEPLRYERERHRPTIDEMDTWGDVLSWDDPTVSYLQRFRTELARRPEFLPTNLSRDDYLAVIAGIVDFFRGHQGDRGAIIDPYRRVEYQYSTPCFAWAASALVVYAGRADLLEPAARAVDWSVHSLSLRQAASAHEDFFAPQIAHAMAVLKPRVDPNRYRQWEESVRAFDPWTTYRASPGGGNWNVVALSGEGLLFQLGCRTDPEYVESCLAAQGRWFGSPWGLYTEGPMAYDHFPRIWAADLLESGFEGRNVGNLREVLRRGAITSLFLQSPTGELPVGGRSAHHQWNEAEQCVSYEIYAARAAASGDEELSGVFKRAARLALGSILRWVRPSGELWIVKNRCPPADGHGYEGYSSHSQYNLLAAAMLAIAYEHAAATTGISERATPADIGGFVIPLPAPFHKVFANAGGTYVEIDWNADLVHNPTGLLRVHRAGCDPQIGPSDGLSALAGYRLPDGPRTSAAVGVAWRDRTGAWRRLADSGRAHGRPSGGSAPLAATVEVLAESPGRVEFRLVYRGDFDGPQVIVEHYVLTPDCVEIATELVDYTGPARMIWPVLADDGAGRLRVDLAATRIVVASAGGAQGFEAVGASSVNLGAPLYPCRNGWARVATADFAAGVTPRLRITPTAAAHDGGG